MKEPEIQCSEFDDTIITFFFPYAIDLGCSPEYNEVDSFDARRILQQCGIDVQDTKMIAGTQHDTLSYVVIKFYNAEDFVKAKLSFPHVN